MKKVHSIFLILAVAVGSTLSVQAQKKKPMKLENNLDSVSYSIGSIFGYNLHNYGFEQLNVKVLTQALMDALTPGDTLIKPEKANEIVQAAVQNLMKKKAEKTLADGKAFLEKNKKEAGVVELPSGLQYKVITAGTGDSPSATSIVTAHYKGSLIDGKVFDSSYDRGQPAQFGVSDVIEGWKEALQLMKPGAKWMLYIPSTLAYGENSQPGSPIPANSVLIFEVELISFEAAPANPPAEVTPEMQNQNQQ